MAGNMYLPAPPRARGYPKLASLMSSHHETAIFRRFGKLQMLNLLSLQAELTDLEVKLESIIKEDEESGDESRMLHTVDFRELRHAKEGDDLHWHMLLEMRAKLQEYNDALLQVAQISKLEVPRRDELAFVQSWLERPSMGNSFLRGRESRTWAGRKPREMVTLAQRQMERDPFSTWLSTQLVDTYDRIWGNRRKEPVAEDPDSGIVEYEDTRLTTISNAVGVIFASLVPTISVLVLYFIKNMLVRIGLLVVFTAVFAGALALFTSARKIEIFSAIAAFAAVEVVFIGSTGGPPT